jgi:hypothetical protein
MDESIEKPTEEFNTEPKKRTRKMTPELLEKLRLAREKAVEARKASGSVNKELVQIRSELKKENLGDRVNEVETYKKIKERVNEDIKNNEYVNINKKLEKLDDMYNRFNGYLEEKAKRRQEKSSKEIAYELPKALQQKLLEEELRKQELAAFRKRMFGV